MKAATSPSSERARRRVRGYPKWAVWDVTAQAYRDSRRPRIFLGATVETLVYQCFQLLIRREGLERDVSASIRALARRGCEAEGP